MKRSTVIEELAERIATVKRPHPVRVAIDGVDGVGKTTLAGEVAESLRGLGRSIIRASIDGFHNPRSIRYRRGRNSPEGYFRDSFDSAALTTNLLAPLGPGGSRIYRSAVFDYRTDSEIPACCETASSDAILIFDGVFLLRAELLAYWDLTVFLDAPFEIATRRMSQRDGSSPDVYAEENRRYIEGQKVYLRESNPRTVAMIVVNNENLSSPDILGAHE